METLARSCGDGHWINRVVGLSLGGGVLLAMFLIFKWLDR